MIGFTNFKIGVFFVIQLLLFFAHYGHAVNIKTQGALRRRLVKLKKRHASRWARVYTSRAYKRQEHNSNKKFEKAFRSVVYGFPLEKKTISIEVLNNIDVRDSALVQPFLKLMSSMERHDKTDLAKEREASAVWSFRRQQLRFVRLTPMDESRAPYQAEVDYRLSNHLLSNDRERKMAYSLGNDFTPPLPEWIARIADLEFYATRVVFVLEGFVSRTAVPLEWFNFKKDKKPPSYEAIINNQGVENPPSFEETTVDTIGGTARLEPDTVRQKLSLEFLNYRSAPQVPPVHRRLNELPVAAALHRLKPVIVRSSTEFPKWYFWINSERSEMYLRLIDDKETMFDDIRVIDSYSTLARFIELSPEALVNKQQQGVGSSSKFSAIEQLQLRNRCSLCETRETVYFRVILARLLLQAQGDPWKKAKPGISRNTGLAKRRIDVLFNLVSSKTTCTQFFQTPLSLSEKGVTSVQVTAAYVQKITEGTNMVKYIIGFCGFDNYLCGFDECSVFLVDDHITEFEGAERVRFPPSTWLELKPSATPDGKADLFDWEPVQLLLVRK